MKPLLDSLSIFIAFLAAHQSFANQSPSPAPRQQFEIVALVDSLDFAKNYDIETPTGTVQVLEHVLLTHPTDIWWRDKGGGRMRYPSRCESWQVSEAPFDKKRLPSEDIYGWLRLESPRANAFPLVREECERRGLGFGIHTTLEENHWYSPLASNWTLAHPEFWGRTRGGEPWMGCCSILFPEVVAHKLEMLDERLALRPQAILLDFWRNGSWSFAREYTAPALAEWRSLYGRRRTRAGSPWSAATSTTTSAPSPPDAAPPASGSSWAFPVSTAAATRPSAPASAASTGAPSRRKASSTPCSC